MEYMFEEDMSVMNRYWITADSKEEAERKFENGEHDNHDSKYDQVLDLRKYVFKGTSWVELQENLKETNE